MKFYVKKLLVLTAISALLFSLVACGDDKSEVKMYSDRVYVRDHLFISTGDRCDTLPDGYTYIGTVQTFQQ